MLQEGGELKRKKKNLKTKMDIEFRFPSFFFADTECHYYSANGLLPKRESRTTLVRKRANISKKVEQTNKVYTNNK